MVFSKHLGSETSAPLRRRWPAGWCSVAGFTLRSPIHVRCDQRHWRWCRWQLRSSGLWRELASIHRGRHGKPPAARRRFQALAPDTAPQAEYILPLWSASPNGARGYLRSTPASSGFLYVRRCTSASSSASSHGVISSYHWKAADRVHVPSLGRLFVDEQNMQVVVHDLLCQAATRHKRRLPILSAGARFRNVIGPPILTAGV